ncbi:MAG: response regulator transcription factor [Sphaerochaetaceae bacterium]|jgi:DNA-binding response OmpR family regulator|nr:response regulator transcription factor [Sphaerochaetaceae bacterium]MDC7250281.1 response regulator transcription factor [Sphaerochaetaceae bacterium]
MKKYKILLADDEENITNILRSYLIKEGYETIVANDGKEALRMYKIENPDLIILDLMMPYYSGEQVCKEVRKESRVPIIMLTAKVGEDNLVKGIDLGADDYIEKPFSPKEIIAKVKAVLRRSKNDILVSKPVVYGNLKFDFEKNIFYKNSKLVDLTPTEMKILFTMAKSPNRIFSREDLIIYALQDDFDGFDRSIDTYIKSLRKKIEDDRKRPRYIITKHGMGYSFEI